MSIRPLKESEKVTLDFEFDVSDEYIESMIDAQGVRPSRRWAVSFDLADVPSPVRSRLRKAHALYMEVEPYPLISTPTEEPEEFLEAIEPWIKQVEAEHIAETEETEEREKAEAIASAQFRMEMRDWVEQQGSPRLRAAVRRDYKANTTYAMERAETEMPGFWVDTAGDAEWSERSDPSEAALVIESAAQARLEDLGVVLESRIIWLTEPPRALERWLDDEGYEFEAQEAIVISAYLGRYVLVMPVDPDLRRPQGSD